MGKPEIRPPTTRKWPNRSLSNFARVTTSGSPTIMQNFITMRSGVFDPVYVKLSLLGFFFSFFSFVGSHDSDDGDDDQCVWQHGRDSAGTPRGLQRSRSGDGDQWWTTGSTAPLAVRRFITGKQEWRSVVGRIERSCRLPTGNIDRTVPQRNVCQTTV